jgi:hypothetical protein
MVHASVALEGNVRVILWRMETRPYGISLHYALVKNACKQDIIWNGCNWRGGRYLMAM